MREIIYRSIDARGVPTLLASPSGGNPEGVVVRSEIDDLIAQLDGQISTLRNESEQADANDTSAWQAAIESLSQQVNLLGDSVARQITVGTLATSLADAQTHLQGLDGAVPGNSHLRSALVASGDASLDGIYSIENGVFGRKPGFTEASAFSAGFRIFVDDLNQQYVVFNDAQPVSVSNPAISAVSIGPWTRVEEIIAEAPIEKVGPALRLLFDGGFLAVNNGQLTLATAFQQQLEATRVKADTNEANLGTLGGRVTVAEERISTAEAAVSANTTAVSSFNQQLENTNQRVTFAEEFNAAQNAILVEHTGKIEATESKNAEQDQSLAQHTSKLSQLETSDAAQTTTLNQVTLTQTNHGNRLGTNESSISSLQTGLTAQTSKNTTQDSRLDALESAAAQLAALQSQVNTNVSEIQGVNVSITDAQATIAAHGSRLTGVEGELGSKLNTADLAAQQESFAQTLIKCFSLTNGIVEQRVDSDDGRQYYFTTFKASTGWGHKNFRSFDLSESLSPYTKLGYSYTFQRVDTDSYQIIFQSALASFPNDKVDIALIRIPK